MFARRLGQLRIRACSAWSLHRPTDWGLRDYGTATWDGGDPDCDHRHQLGGEGAASAKQNTSAGMQSVQYRGECRKCGAVRRDAQLGLERTPDEYVKKMVAVFREVWRVLRKDGTLWLNLGDCYNAYNGGAGPSSKLSKRQSSERPRLESGYGLRCDLKPKDLVGIPWRVAFALQADGWWLRSDIVWAKPNPMPESIGDRPTRAHEYVFLLTKSRRYFYDADAIRTPYWNGNPLGEHPRNVMGSGVHASEGVGGQPAHTGLHRPARGWKTPDGWDTSAGNGSHGSFHRDGREEGETGYRHKTARGPHAGGRRQAPEPGEPNAFHPLGANARTVWSIATEPYPEAHFATFPTELARRCILAGSRPGDTVLDPFSGSGTVALVADMLGRHSVGLELNPEYIALAEKRLRAPRSEEGITQAAMEDEGQVRIEW